MNGINCMSHTSVKLACLNKSVDWQGLWNVNNPRLNSKRLYLV